MNWYLLKKTPSKARRDVCQIVEGMGFQNLGITKKPLDNAVLDFLVTLVGMLKVPFVVKNGDVVLLPYNLRKYYGYLCWITHWRGGKVVSLIHDLSSFYRKHITAEEEIRKLNASDYLIAHNPEMKRWLEENGCERPIGVLEIFDYLSGKEPKEKEVPEQPYSVLYAGTLAPEKNNYLYLLEEHIHSYTFNLYGKGFDEKRIKQKEKFSYKGFVSSDDLVQSGEGDFGLVWDGNSIDELDGPRGRYMLYNNPHKFSLYLRCELPVIVWEKAAIADFVRKNNVGICISSLRELDQCLQQITQEEYLMMKNNAREIGEKLGKGYYFKKAFNAFLSQDGKGNN